MYRESKRRVRWIKPDQVKTLLAELPVHQRDIVLFALATGLRQNNVTRLTWSQVDLERGTGWIAGEDAKGKENIPVSLSPWRWTSCGASSVSILSLCSPMRADRWARSTHAHGVVRCSGLAFQTFAGTIYVTPGQVG